MSNHRLLHHDALPRAQRGDPDAIALLADLVRDPASSRRLRDHAIRGLSRAGPVAAPAVRGLAEDGLADPALPWALGVVGTARDAQLLLPFFHQRRMRVRYNAVAALDELGAPTTHEGYRLALRDRRMFVRARAFESLRQRSTDVELLDALESARNDLPWHRFLARRYLALWALGASSRVLRG